MGVGVVASTTEEVEEDTIKEARDTIEEDMVRRAEEVSVGLTKTGDMEVMAGVEAAMEVKPKMEA